MRFGYTHLVELKQIDGRWIEKFAEMSCSPVFGKSLTGPHLTAVPENYHPQQVPSILYVGKALGGKKTPAPYRTIEQVRDAVACTIDDVKAGNCRTDFWDFALQLSDALARSTGHQGIDPLQNLIWSNIFKIGQVSKDPNPTREVQECQKDLAIETLRAEIRGYQPKVVVWVTGGYGLDVLRAVVRDPNETLWNKQQEEKDLYWRVADLSTPAMLWTGHPQFKRKYWQAWIDQACELVEG